MGALLEGLDGQLWSALRDPVLGDRGGDFVLDGEDVVSASPHGHPRRPRQRS